MGRRKPCCDKERVKKGTWSAGEDAILRAYAEKLPIVTNWMSLPNKIGLNRCGKSARLRWLNYLHPKIKHGKFSEEEDKIILDTYFAIGSRWSVIADKLPGRTDNDIKNYWNTKLSKTFDGYKKKPHSRRCFTGYMNPTTTTTQFDNNIIYPGSSKNNKNKKKENTTFTITHGDVMSTTWPSDSQLFFQQHPQMETTNYINGGIGLQMESNYASNSTSYEMLARINNEQSGNATSAAVVHVSPSLKELEDMLFENVPEMDSRDLVEDGDMVVICGESMASWDVPASLLANSDNIQNCDVEFLPNDILDEFSNTTDRGVSFSF